jgi:hypothetical protein
MTSPVSSEKTWKLAPVEYLKYDDGGAQIPYYKFKITSAPHDLLTMTGDMTGESLGKALTDTTLKEAEYAAYLPSLYEHLFATNAKLFTRKYDPTACSLRSHHTFSVIPAVAGETGPYTCILSPKELRLMNSKFYIAWAVELAAELEVDVDDGDIPLMADTIAQTSAVVAPAPSLHVEDSAETIDLIEIDDVESDKEDTVSESSLPLRPGLTDRQIRDRQRVEEARLRAKLAAFRAQRAMERYIHKYGDLTDSDATEYTETEAESDESE